MREEGGNKDYIWQERKRLWCGLPWTFTTYAMSKDRLFVRTGLLTTREYEVRLYRIVNISISRTLIQRMFGLSTIHVDSSDRDLASFDIVNIRHGAFVKEALSETVEKERTRNRVSARELMVDADDEDIDGDGIPD